MKSIFFSFLLLFNFSTHVISCPSSGDGDCIPSNDIYNQSSNQAIKETSDISSLSSHDNNESDDGFPDNYIVKSSSYLKNINEKSKLSSKIERLNFDLDNIIYNSSKQYNTLN